MLTTRRLGALAIGVALLSAVSAGPAALKKSSAALSGAEELNNLPVEDKKAQLHGIAQSLAAKEAEVSRAVNKHDKMMTELMAKAKDNAQYRADLQKKIQLLEEEIKLAKTEIELSKAKDQGARIKQQMKIVSEAELGTKGKSALFESNWGGTEISDSPTVEGNKGWAWNVGDNFAEPNSKALAHGWTSGANTVHSGGVGMFGNFGVAVEGCQPGSYSRNGWMPCTQCAAGKFQALPSQKSCEDCQDGYTSNAGATQCYVDVPTGSCNTREANDYSVTDQCDANTNLVEGDIGGELSFTMTANREICEWTITPPQGKATRFAITYMNLESGCDYVKINEICFDGHVTHAGFTVTTSSVAIHFSSDGSVFGEDNGDVGFTMTWEFVDMPSNLVDGTTVY